MASTKPTMVKLATAVKKIDSPLAKYNSAGQLMCIVCNTVVKSEAVWTAHIHGRQHREQVAALKNSKEELSKPQSSVKRKADVSSQVTTASPAKKGVPGDFFDSPSSKAALPAKPIKSILKNSSKPLQPPTTLQTVVSTNVENEMETDEPQSVQPPSKTSVIESSSSEMVPSTAASTSLPEGFFDDPKLEAKVRQIEFKDPVEEEWNKFQKEINEEVNASAALQEEDQEESTAERQLEEIEEQMLKWSRVVELEKKKEMYIQRVQAMKQAKPMEEDSSSDDDAEMDTFFDWRSKAT